MDNEDKKFSEHFRYFYEGEQRKFQFHQLPRVLLEDEAYKRYSLHCKVLYSILLSRTSLSEENGWIDNKGRIFVYLSIKEACKQLGCSNKSCTKYFNELDEETGLGLIKRVRSSFSSKSVKIYVCNFSEKIIWDYENHCICKTPGNYQDEQNTPCNLQEAKHAGQNQNVISTSCKDQDEQFTPPRCNIYTSKMNNLHPNNINNNNININNNSTCNINHPSLSLSLDSNTNPNDNHDFNIDMTCNGIPTMQEVIDFGASVRDSERNAKNFYNQQVKRNWRFDNGAFIRNWKDLYLKWKKANEWYESELLKTSKSQIPCTSCTDGLTEEEQKQWKENCYTKAHFINQ